MTIRNTTTILILAATCGLIVASTASASRQGDPRVCRYERPAYCGDLAARAAFKQKYQRVTGHTFVGSLLCPVVAPLTYVCRWGSAGRAIRKTVVRFADKPAGWVFGVGVIPADG